MSEQLSCCFTGYRPDKLPFNISNTDAGYISFENSLTSVLVDLIKNGCDTFYTGMAMGFDIIAAEAVLSLMNSMPDAAIHLICVLPFSAQSKSFPDEWKRRYDNIISQSDDVILLSDKYYPYCYMARNKYMVDNSDFVLTYFDGKSGGTAGTIKYAERKKRQIINLCNK